MSELPLVRLDPGLPVPDRAHPDDAGLDLRTTVDVEIAPGDRVLVGTGVAVALPPGHVGWVCPRSGLAVRSGLGLVNAPGVVDAGYRGEIRVCLVNHDPREPVSLRRGDRVAQLVVQRVELPAVRVVDALPDTVRGSGGFGSTGLSGDPRGVVGPATSREGHGQGIEYGAGMADAGRDGHPVAGD
ncbi:dUTP diphosphatase [Actinomycetospora sp. OC33-EN08]|uniref:Deoxyuridine 5'-triphosphate nucleotidohydrolase n=1 Tax=Actinomycetospora aurantiaca TaxID=3129233 RepID=A0ABU8MLV5_9PSEU